MDSLDTVLTNLRKVATDNQYEGPVIDALISLIANGVYMNTLNAISTVLEASPTRCKLINSAIQHAKDRGYSVYRGRNQRVVIRDAMSTATVSYVKYDQIAKVGKFYLLVADDTLDLVAGTKKDEINLIVATSPVLTEQVTGNNSLSIHTTLTSNYSEDVDVYVRGTSDTNNDVTVLDYSEYKRDVLRDYSVEYDKIDVSRNIRPNPIKVWLTTSTDYGIELYMFDRSLLTIANIDIYKVEASSESDDIDVAKVISNLSTFRSEYVYTFMGVEYTSDSIESTSIIKSIPGIKFDNSNLSLVAGNSRMSDVPVINSVADLVNISNNIVRTTYELKTLINKELMSISNSVNSTYIMYTNVYNSSDEKDTESQANSVDINEFIEYSESDNTGNPRGCYMGIYSDTTEDNELSGNRYTVSNLKLDTQIDKQLSILIFTVNAFNEDNSDKSDVINIGIDEATFTKLLSGIKSAYYVSDNVYTVPAIKVNCKYTAKLYNNSVANIYNIKSAINEHFNYRIGGTISGNEVSAFILSRFPEISYVILSDPEGDAAPVLPITDNSGSNEDSEGNGTPEEGDVSGSGSYEGDDVPEGGHDPNDKTKSIYRANLGNGITTIPTGFYIFMDLSIELTQ